MSYISKTAQRKIDASNRAIKQLRAERADRNCNCGALNPQKHSAECARFWEPIQRNPTQLKAGQPGAGMWDVYFNGVRQHLCSYADSLTGKITRFLSGVGTVPTTSQTETLQGAVQIVRKGQRPTVYGAKHV